MINFYLIFFTFSVAFMLIMYGISLKLKKADLADFGWVILIFASILFSLIDSDNFNLANFIMLALILIWSFKLGSRILIRILTAKKEDSRYAYYRNQWGSSAWYKFLIIFMLQPIFVLFLSLPFVIGNYYGANLSFLAIAISLIGMLGSYIADRQLSIFKQTAKGNEVCEQGLWAYSRHPNYFFEWITWCAYVFFLTNNQYFMLALLSPIVMYCLLVYGTGIPPLELVAVKNKGQKYIDYQKTTNKFFLGGKKK